MRTRLRLLPEFFGVVAFGFILYAIMLALQGSIKSNSMLFSFNTWLKEAPDNPLYRFLWFFGDVTEAEFYASLLGGIGIPVPGGGDFPSPTAPGFGPGSLPLRP
jgi:hypothetical protein